MSPGQEATRGGAVSLARWRPVFVDDLIRIGRAHDGGYVVSRRSVESAKVLVGLGINDDWSFEEDFQRRNPAIRIIGVDGSVSEEVFRERATRARMQSIGHLVCLRRWNTIHHHREALHWRERARAFRGFFGSGDRVFHQRYISNADDGSALTWAGLRRLEPALMRDEPLPALFMKVDIEGGEYRVLSEVLQDAARISGLVVEFHDIDILFERFAELMTRADRHLAVVHVHGNNWMPLIPGTACPTTLEVTFLNRALLPAGARPSKATYPIEGLDMPNHPGRTDYPLTF